MAPSFGGLSPQSHQHRWSHFLHYPHLLKVLQHPNTAPGWCHGEGIQDRKGSHASVSSICTAFQKLYLERGTRLAWWVASQPGFSVHKLSLCLITHKSMGDLIHSTGLLTKLELIPRKLHLNFRSLAPYIWEWHTPSALQEGPPTLGDCFPTMTGSALYMIRQYKALLYVTTWMKFEITWRERLTGLINDCPSQWKYKKSPHMMH